VPNFPSFYPKDSLLALEIAQQPTLWPTTLERVQSAGLFYEQMTSPVVLTGAGTSAYAGAAIAEAWPSALAIPTTDLLIQSAQQIASLVPSLPEGGTLISLARSGDSPESVAVVERFQKFFPRVRHVAIVCNANGRLARTPGVQVITLDPRTNDRSLAMTGSFSNLVLAGLALVHREQLSKQLPALCSLAENRLEQSAELVAKIASACADRVVILSSAMQALAKEAALKIIELTDGRVLALPETFLGLRHGPIGFLREDTPVLCFLSSDLQKQLYERDLIDDLRDKGLGKLILVGEDPSLASPRDWYLPLIASSLPDSLRTPFEIPIAQLLAYCLSVSTNVNPDNPSPKGTITRVVKPFRIHKEALQA